MSKPALVTLPAALALSVLLSACATAPALRGPETTGLAAGDDSSVYGLYLAGAAAMDDGSTRLAAGYLDAAARRAPEAGELKSQAFAAALLSGEIEQAAALAPAVAAGSDGSGLALGQLTRAVEALSKGRDREAYDDLSPSTMGVHWAAGALLRPWAAAGAGDV